MWVLFELSLVHHHTVATARKRKLLERQLLISYIGDMTRNFNRRRNFIWKRFWTLVVDVWKRGIC
jgi:hypothetical protein